MRNGNQFINTVVSLALLGSTLVGFVSFVAALFPMFNGEYVAAGVLLIASALAFGLLSIAVLVK